jgi:hypothetical protein
MTITKTAPATKASVPFLQFAAGILGIGALIIGGVGLLSGDPEPAIPAVVRQTTGLTVVDAPQTDEGLQAVLESDAPVTMAEFPRQNWSWACADGSNLWSSTDVGLWWYATGDPDQWEAMDLGEYGRLDSDGNIPSAVMSDCTG